jgi:hypothetical protein
MRKSTIKSGRGGLAFLLTLLFSLLFVRFVSEVFIPDLLQCFFDCLIRDRVTEVVDNPIGEGLSLLQ